MGKILSEKERKLQRKLIPLNIFVCLLSLVAAASLMFGQIFSVDVGKILSSESTIAFVDETVGNIVDESTSGGEDGSQVDFKPVVSLIIKNVLGSAEGSVNVSAFNSAKVAFASGEDKAGKVMDELFFGETALVTRLIDSIVDNVAGMFKTPEGKQLIEEMVVTTITASLVANLSEADAAKVTQEISEITAVFKELDSAEDREAAAAAADKFVDKLNGVLGDSFDKESDGEAVKEYILDMYDDTISETEDFSVEAMISVAVSKNIDLSSFDLGSLFGGSGEEPEDKPEGSAHKRVVEDEIGGTETGSGEEEGGSETDPDNPDPVDPVDPDPNPDPNPDPVDPDNPDNPDDPDPNPDPNPNPEPNPEPNPDEEDRVIYTTYDGLLKGMGLDDSKTEELKATLRESLQNLVQGYTEPAEEYFAYYGYIFYGMLAFVVPWLILFLFSFFHMFAKNKRFMMWYVKLYSWIPGLISLAFILSPKFIDKVPMEENMLGIIKSVIEGISSQMWISGICFIVLWLVSIFWAFPIKHKIRKERKLAKMYGSNGGGPAGGAPNGGNNGNNGGYYQPPHGDNPYNNNPYGNNSPYGNNGPYGNNNRNGNNNYYGMSPYGQPSYGGNSYGNQYGNPYGDVLDQDAYDHGGFNAPYTGSYYGFDEDDF